VHVSGVMLPCRDAYLNSRDSPTRICATNGCDSDALHQGVAAPISWQSFLTVSGD
jgi:hypothetical protein